MPQSAPQPSSASSIAVEKIRTRILTNDLLGGDPVREEDMAEQLGMSRTPVREAIARLLAEGLLTKEENQTARVFRPSLAELLQIYEIRLPLEILAVGLAASRTGGSPKELTTQLGALKSATPQEWMTRHEAFHAAIFAMASRPRLYELLRSLRSQSEPYVRFLVHSDPRFRRQSLKDHRDLAAAVLAGERAVAEDIVRRHLAASTEKIQELMALGEPHYS